MADKLPTAVDLKLLAWLEGGEVVTQMSLSRHIGVSIGLVNARFKRATREGYVKTRAAPYKRYAYYLTPSCFSGKNRLVADYPDVFLRFFCDAREQYAEGFRRLDAVGLRLRKSPFSLTATMPSRSSSCSMPRLVAVALRVCGWYAY